MQTRTEIGVNHSGMGAATKGAEKMLENTELTKPKRGDARSIAKVRMKYAAEAEPVGSMPEPRKAGIEAVLADKLGERMAFERAGVRLYDALLAKCGANGKADAPPIQELEHIREEEAEHFALLGKAIESLGGDPTAQTPAADMTGVEGAGLMQALTDPKTTIAQALHAILIAEMVDNAAWEELIEIADAAGQSELVQQFAKAQEQEAEHWAKVQRWYKEATMTSERR